MNTRNLLVSVLMLVCVVLSACSSAVTATQAPTAAPQPTAVLPTQTQVTTTESTVNLDQVPDLNISAETFPVDDVFNDRVPVFAFDSIWFLSTTDSEVTRWNPETRQELAVIAVGDSSKTPYGDPVAGVATDDALWVTSVAAHEIVKIDPQTNQIVDHIAIPKMKSDFITNRMNLAGNTVWVWDYDAKSAQGIDLNTRQVVGTLENVYSTSSLEGSLWVSNSMGAAQLDAMTNEIAKQFPAGTPLPAISADGSVWGFTSTSIWRMDSQTGHNIAKINLGTPIRDMNFSNGSLWVTVSLGPQPACHKESYLVQIDPKTNAVTGKIALDCPFDIIPYKDGLWVGGGDESQFLLTYIQP